MRALFVAFILVVLAWHCADGAPSKSAAKKRNQVLKKRAGTASTASSSSQSDPTLSKNSFGLSSDGDGGESPEDEVGELDILYDGSAKASDEISCPPCAVRTFVLEHALAQFWSHDVSSAFACVCEILQANPNDQMARALLTTLRSSRLVHKNTLRDIAAPTKNAKQVLSSWEVLGPMSVGKLELDGDSTFADTSFRRQHRGDVASYILAMPANATVTSDLISGSHISWQPFVAKSGGQVELHFQVEWNDLVQGLANTAVYELQAWARASTYVKETGSYLLDCQGVHTVYVRNDNLTRILIGDVYRAQQVRATVDLKAGIVGIVLPIRAALQGTFRCELTSAPTSMMVFPPSDVPHLVEFPSSPNVGYLLSNVFRIVVHNPFHQAVTFEYGLEKPAGGWVLREATGSLDPSIAPRHSPISAGQTMALSLELIQTLHPKDSPVPPSLPCRSRPMHILLTPSRGPPSELVLDLMCRKHTQSFHLSFLDHDHSVAQAAVILPLDFHSPQLASAVKHFRAQAAHSGSSGSSSNGGGAAGPKKARGTRSRKPTDPLPRPAAEGSPSPPSGASSSAEAQRESDEQWERHIHERVGYPLLLSLHGSGIAALSHADAHKLMLPGATEYTFGVHSYYLLAPSRFGAHNWEGTGYETALSAMRALSRLVEAYPSLLPRLHSTSHAIVSGHSMGGHGAWMVAHRHPDVFPYALPASGWIKKEEYSSGNAFQDLDQSTSYLDARLKHILETSWAEFHVDRLASNLAHSRVHLRVGSHDLTTHPWYSRRMYRVLRGVQANVSLEECPSKQHWWWDSLQANDGGVLNDDVLRAFYASCHAHFVQAMQLARRHADYRNHTRGDGHLLEASTGAATFAHYLVHTATEGSLEKDQRAARRTQAVHWLHTQRCQTSVELSVLNPAVHSSLCGVRILDAHRVLSLATVRVHVHTRVSAEGVERECRVTTGNVRRLSVRMQWGDICVDATHLLVNGRVVVGPPHTSASSPASFHPPLLWTVCLSAQSRDSAHVLCPEDSLSALPPQTASAPVWPPPLARKVSANFGPLRHIYARPVVLIYGTPADQRLRVAMKDLALYVANAHWAAHHSLVTVYSDLEYRTSAEHKAGVLANYLFIGDAHTNKVLKLLSMQETQDRGKWTLPLQVRLPSGLVLEGYRARDLDDDDDDDDNGEGDGAAQRWTAAGHLPDEGDMLRERGRQEESRDASSKAPRQGFSLGEARFDQPDQAIAFTMPIMRHALGGLSSAVSMAVCLYANTAQGYLHLSRLAWPVIPPMVRSPLGANLPDFVVLDHRIWSLGPGGLLAAGFWNMDWEYDPDNSYLAAIYQ